MPFGSTTSEICPKEMPSVLFEEVIPFDTTTGFFTENIGQWDENILFCSRTDFGFAFFERDGITYDLKKENHAVKVSFASFENSEPEGKFDLGFPSNYFFGKDPDAWVTGARSFERIEYKDVWPSIDIEYYFHPSGLKYDVIVGDDGDPENINLEVSGLESLDVRGDELVLHLGGSLSIMDKELKAFNDQGEMKDVDFKLIGDRRYGFDLEKQEGETVIIDPLVYSTVISGTMGTLPADMKKDELNCTYLMGVSFSADFPTTPGAYDIEYNTLDLYVTKLNSTGTGLVFSTFLGGNSMEVAEKIAIDDNYNVYVTGATYGKGFPTTPGVIREEVWAGGPDIFVTKLNSSGSKLDYSTIIAGSSSDFPLGINVYEGNVYLLGESASKDLEGAYGPMGGIHGIGFFSIINSNATAFIDSVFWDGFLNEYPSIIERDKDGNLIIAGWTISSDFPTTPHSFQFGPSGNGECGIIMKYDPFAKNMVFSSKVGEGFIYDMTLDENSDIIFAGCTRSDPWGYIPTFPLLEEGYMNDYAGFKDGFVGKLLNDGSDLEWMTLFGGMDNDTIFSIDLDEAGNVYAYGTTESFDLPTTETAYNRTFGGDKDAFVVKLNNNASNLLYSSFIGRSLEEQAVKCHLTERNNITIMGSTTSIDFPKTEGAFNTSEIGWGGMFLSVLTMQTVPSPPLNLMCVGGDGNISLTWEQPIDDGRSDLTGYSIYRSKNPQSPELFANVGLETTYVDEDVIFGKEYYYWISAKNGIGEGLMSNRDSNVSFTYPSPPRNLMADVRIQEIELTFTPPTFTGGLNITHYSLYRNTEHISDIQVDHTKYRDVDIELGTEYMYEITSWNEKGESNLSDPITVISKDYPSPPKDLAVLCYDKTVYLSWNEPLYFGGLDIIGYMIYKGSGLYEMSPLQFLNGGSLEYQDNQVITGIEYFYSISAFNEIGESERSYNVTTSPLTVPSPPQMIMAKAYWDHINISWSSPVNDGGTEIIAYRLYHIENWGDPQIIARLPGSSNIYEHKGLYTPSTHHYFVTAINYMGESERSIQISCSIETLPRAPSKLFVEPGVMTIRISWEAPVNKGSGSMVGYNIYKRSESSNKELLVHVDYASDEYIDGNVMRGRIYHYSIETVTEVGLSEHSAEISGMSLSNPDPPAEIAIDLFGKGFLVSWAPPEYYGGTPVTWYNLYRLNPDGVLILRIQINGNITQFEDIAVIAGGEYLYYVTAINDIGTSSPSENVTASTLMLPYSPEITVVEVSGGKVILKWMANTSGGGVPRSFNLFRIVTNETIEHMVNLDERITIFIDDDVLEGGKYEYFVTAVNAAGESENSLKVIVEIPTPLEKQNESGILISLYLAGFLFLLLLLLGIVAVMKRKREGMGDEIMDWGEE